MMMVSVSLKENSAWYRPETISTLVDMVIVMVGVYPSIVVGSALALLLMLDAGDAPVPVAAACRWDWAFRSGRSMTTSRTTGVGRGGSTLSWPSLSSWERSYELHKYHYPAEVLKASELGATRSTIRHRAAILIQLTFICFTLKQRIAVDEDAASRLYCRELAVEVGLR
jgi:hypothetical protein